MSEYILKTSNLTKKYKNYKAINNVSLSLEAGKIYGLIGRNGAGKSTFMKLIAGLSYPDEGHIELFGHTKESEIQLERKRIGCMIESPSINLSMTAKENMKLHRIIRGIPDEKIEDELLSLLDINNTGKKKVKNFSLGMKQRLGIAITLINSPEFLILDEPINGLDPLGVVEIRKLLTKLCNEKNMTILISSHNLPEMYQLATDYIFINKGEIIQTLSLEELDEYCRHYLLIKSTDVYKLVNVIERKLNTTNFKVMPDYSVQLFDYIDDKEFVGKTLFDNNIVVTNLSNEGGTLEDYFVSLVGGVDND
ncbi:MULTISPECIES: ABC transporter ATP-binding protein [Clostridia]|mgnify:FL=1|jgi:ABC-2 type transport system ATP-binding protein|uniref:ABC transporter ATP-binding protein n=1 Tax=Clostridia TaxID=186801 RepID=UPI0018AA0751|nr:ABC transporter ATP-binding protein [Clostridium sp. 1001270J_160509_D11]